MAVYRRGLHSRWAGVGWGSLLALALCTALLVLFPASSVFAPGHSIQARAPFEVLASALHEPSGLARDPQRGDLFISEAVTGVIVRLDPQGQVSTHATGLARPRGLAWDPSREGSPATLLVVDEEAGTLSRIHPTQGIILLRSDLKKPHGVAVGPDGTIYVTAEEGAGFRLRGPEQGVLLQFAPDGSNPQLLAMGLKRRAGLWVLAEGRIRFVADRLRTESERDGGTIFEVPPEGEIEVLVRSGFKKPHALSLDALGATYLTADQQREEARPEKGVIGKAFSEDGVALFATGLQEPRGLVFDAQGHLYVVEADAGRLLKFRAPPPPALNLPPPVTNQATLTLRGTAEPHSLVTVRGAEGPLPPQADVSAQVTVHRAPARFDPRTGLLLQDVTVTNTGALPLAGPLAFVVAGLTPPEVTLAHEQPIEVHGSLAVRMPLLGGLLRPGDTARTVLRFRGAHRDSPLSYTAQVWTLQPLAVTDAEGHFTLPVTLPPNIETDLEVFATAALGLGLTSASTPITVTHDDTPPETTITAGPAGQVGAPEAEFTFTGTDNLTPPEALQFAWRLDGAPWSAFALTQTVRITRLAKGPHLFEVTARDLAGNEDPTPAQQSVTVSSLTVRITQPADGATISSDRVLVRGTVSGATAEIGVVVDGTPAHVVGADWVAPDVPLLPGATNVLRAAATDSQGSKATASVSVSVPANATPPLLVLTTLPASGLAPHSVSFTLSSALPNPIASVTLDFGDGSPPFSGPALEGVNHTYSKEGVYTATATVTDTSAGRSVATTMVSVIPLPDFPGKWASFKAALARGDIEGALQAMAVGIRSRYRPALQALGGDLPALAATLGDLQIISVQGGLAEAAAVRLEDGQRRVYFIYFVPDDDGIWRIRGM